MQTHEPPGYECPFCRLAGGGESERNTQADVVRRDDETIAFVAPKWWVGNDGHVLVAPTRHYENLYATPPEILGAVYATVREVAIAIRATYGCDGTSTRQHNEPGGNQDVWHLHVHVFPRYAGDRLYANDEAVRWVDAAERAPYAERLRRFLGAQSGA